MSDTVPQTGDTLGFLLKQINQYSKNTGVVKYVLHFKTVFTETFTINMANEMYSL